MYSMSLIREKINLIKCLKPHLKLGLIKNGNLQKDRRRMEEEHRNQLLVHGSRNNKLITLIIERIASVEERVTRFETTDKKLTDENTELKKEMVTLREKTSSSDLLTQYKCQWKIVNSEQMSRVLNPIIKMNNTIDEPQ